MIKTVMLVALTAAVTDNLVLVRFQGLHPAVALERGGAVKVFTLCAVLVMLLSGALIWPLYYRVLQPRGLDYLEIPALLLISGSFAQISELIFLSKDPGEEKDPGYLLPLIGSNSAVILGVLGGLDRSYTFLYHMVFTAGSALGFALAMYLTEGVLTRTRYSKVPESFRGVAIAFISAAIISMAFIGFTGVVNGLFYV